MTRMVFLACTTSLVSSLYRFPSEVNLVLSECLRLTVYKANYSAGTIGEGYLPGMFQTKL